MKSRMLIIMVLSVLIISCTGGSDNTGIVNEKVVENESYGDSLSMIKEAKTKQDSLYDKLNLRGEKVKYVHENDTLQRSLTVTFTNTIDTIYFDYSINNSLRKITNTFSGTAISNPLYVEASFENDGQVGPLVKQYYSNSKDCSFIFSFDNEKFMWIFASMYDCPMKEKVYIESYEKLKR